MGAAGVGEAEFVSQQSEGSSSSAGSSLQPGGPQPVGQSGKLCPVFVLISCCFILFIALPVYLHLQTQTVDLNTHSFYVGESFSEVHKLIPHLSICFVFHFFSALVKMILWMWVSSKHKDMEITIRSHFSFLITLHK